MPQQRVDIPGVGIVEFPEGMTGADIDAAAERLYNENQGELKWPPGEPTGRQIPPPAAPTPRARESLLHPSPDLSPVERANRRARQSRAEYPGVTQREKPGAAPPPSQNVLQQTAFEPLIHLEPYAQKYFPSYEGIALPEQVERGVAIGMARLAEGFTSPATIATIGAAGTLSALSATLRVLIGIGFTGQLAADAIIQAPELVTDVKEGRYDDAAARATQMAGSAGLAGMIGGHTLKAGRSHPLVTGRSMILDPRGPGGVGRPAMEPRVFQEGAGLEVLPAHEGSLFPGRPTELPGTPAAGALPGVPRQPRPGVRGVPSTQGIYARGTPPEAGVRGLLGEAPGVDVPGAPPGQRIFRGGARVGEAPDSHPPVVREPVVVGEQTVVPTARPGTELFGEQPSNVLRQQRLAPDFVGPLQEPRVAPEPQRLLTSPSMGLPGPGGGVGGVLRRGAEPGEPGTLGPFRQGDIVPRGRPGVPARVREPGRFRTRDVGDPSENLLADEPTVRPEGPITPEVLPPEAKVEGELTFEEAEAQGKVKIVKAPKSRWEIGQEWYKENSMERAIVDEGGMKLDMNVPEENAMVMPNMGARTDARGRNMFDPVRTLKGQGGHTPDQMFHILQDNGQIPKNWTLSDFMQAMSDRTPGSKGSFPTRAPADVMETMDAAAERRTPPEFRGEAPVAPEGVTPEVPGRVVPETPRGLGEPPRNMAEVEADYERGRQEIQEMRENPNYAGTDFEKLEVDNNLRRQQEIQRLQPVQPTTRGPGFAEIQETQRERLARQQREAIEAAEPKEPPVAPEGEPDIERIRERGAGKPTGLFVKEATGFNQADGEWGVFRRDPSGQEALVRQFKTETDARWWLDQQGKQRGAAKIGVGEEPFPPERGEPTATPEGEPVSFAEGKGQYQERIREVEGYEIDLANAAEKRPPTPSEKLPIPPDVDQAGVEIPESPEVQAFWKENAAEYGKLSDIVDRIEMSGLERAERARAEAVRDQANARLDEMDRRAAEIQEESDFGPRAVEEPPVAREGRIPFAEKDRVIWRGQYGTVERVGGGLVDQVRVQMDDGTMMDIMYDELKPAPPKVGSEPGKTTGELPPEAPARPRWGEIPVDETLQAEWDRLDKLLDTATGGQRDRILKRMDEIGLEVGEGEARPTEPEVTAEGQVEIVGQRGFERESKLADDKAKLEMLLSAKPDQTTAAGRKAIKDNAKRERLLRADIAEQERLLRNEPEQAGMFREDEPALFEGEPTVTPEEDKVGLFSEEPEVEAEGRRPQPAPEGTKGRGQDYVDSISRNKDIPPEIAEFAQAYLDWKSGAQTESAPRMPGQQAKGFRDVIDSLVDSDLPPRPGDQSTLYSNPIGHIMDVWSKNYGPRLHKYLFSTQEPYGLVVKPWPEPIKWLFINRHRQPPEWVEDHQQWEWKRADGQTESFKLGKQMSQNLSQADQLKLGQLLRGEATEAELRAMRDNPQWNEAIDAVKTARARFDEYGALAAQQGLLEEETFFKNYGRYMPRLYRRWEVDYDAQLKQYGVSRPTRLDMDRWKKRGDIPEEVRVMMGEILEPGYPVAKGLAQIIGDVETAKLFNKVADHPDWTFEPEKFWDMGKDPNQYTQMPVTPKLGRLSGKFVNKYIASELNQMTKVRGQMDKVSRALVSEWKFNKVIFNPATHGRNMISNTMLAYLSGLPPWRVDIYAKAMSELWQQKGPHYDLAKEQGLFSTTFAKGELDSLIDSWNSTSGGLYDRVGGMADHFAQGEIAEGLGKIRPSTTRAGQRAAKIYQGEEAWFKLAKFIQEIENGAKPKAAAQSAQKALFDYTEVPPFVEWARASPVGAPFITFTYKALPQIIETGITHPWRLGSLVAGIYALEEAARQQLGIEEDQMELIKRVMPERMKGNPLGLGPRALLLPFKDKYGQLQFMDLTYILPWGDVGEQGASGIFQGTPGYAGPLRAVAEIMLNTSGFTGEEIYGENDTKAEVAQKISDHIYKFAAPSLAPGGYGFERVWKSAWGEEDYFGRVSSPGTAIASAILGLKTNPIDPEIEIFFRRKDFEDGFEDLEAAAYRVRNHKGLDLEEKQKQLTEIQRKAQDLRRAADQMFRGPLEDRQLAPPQGETQVQPEQ